jgi:hypothetical protein
MQQAKVVFLGMLQLALLTAALWDIARRPDDEIKGSKRMWRLVVFINFVGPIAYFLFGRTYAPEHK